MTITVLTVLCLLLSGYAAVTIVLYLVTIRPRLRSLAEQGAAKEQVSPQPDPTPVAEQSAGELPAEEWRLTFDAILDPVVILDLDLAIVKSNRAAVELLSADNGSIEGKTCHQLFAGIESPCRLCPIPSVRREQQPVRREIYHRFLGRTFSVSCSPILREQKIVGYVYTAKDISLQRNLEKRLVHAYKLEAIATLAGGIAHDFNNILGAVLGNADLLLYRLPSKKTADSPTIGPPVTPEEIVEHVQAIKRAGNRAKDLVSQILAFSRQSTNQRQNLLLGPVVKEACRLLRASLPATIELKVSVAGELGMIHADPSQIQQVLMNLCTNAAQAIDTRTGGVIEIALREIETGKGEELRYHKLTPGRYVVLTVKDTGKGIPAEMLERIFDPFFTTRDVGEGSGMGLAVLHGIIVSHEGVIDVQSEVGKGSVFTVFFPRVQDKEPMDENHVDTMPQGSETILFVDDEEDIVQMRTRMLTYLGYRVLPATSPEQALAYLAKEDERIDLLVTDHTMPRMTGLQLAAEVHARRPDLPVILCSGYSEAVTPEEAHDAGVSRFLAKPVDMRMLAMTIREILPERNQKEEGV
ncbi:hybrid sensor histidine kinase/response regulator [Desulfobulbus alkaliphilus]|uniref:hybrid sensor histidine kinase/response regulator n=1 Tax=Desulfobulbus alkaliphilus TaxID=869814 RepID=UPI001962E9B6|nr:ATP-binding protein [Desulfobulbus alkaliphilus]MBM9536339.1 response regulator [Desulfobulbus alkaliphilus]